MSSRADQRHWRELLADVLTGHSSTRIVVLAAHPDDETIGASALLARIYDSTVVYLTDGAPRDPKLWSPDFNGTREEYANLRRHEALRALSCANVSETQIHWLGAIDQEAVFQTRELAARFFELLRALDADVVITHPYEGGHPDHDTAALVCDLALRQFGEDSAPRLLEMTSYHAQDGRCVTGEFLASDLQGQICLQLTDCDREYKNRMFASYASQRLVLGAFDTTQESWRPAPRYDFTQPPHDGRLWYERMRWPMTGARWRALAAESLATQQEHSCR